MYAEGDPKASRRDPKGRPKGAKGNPKGDKGIPKGDPKDGQMEPKASTGRQREPKGSGCGKGRICSALADTTSGPARVEGGV